MKMGWTMTAKLVEKKSTWRYLGYVPTWIVGIQYCEAEAAPGEQLYLEPEPDNPVDPLAMAVFSSSGDRLGYLPRYDAAVFTPAVNRGCLILKAQAEHSSSEYKTGLRLEVYASAKSDSWFEPMRGDSLLDILHNGVLGVWLNQETYSSSTIMAFRDAMRERAHGQNLHIETSILYRLLRGVCTEKHNAEKNIFRRLVDDAFKADAWGEATGSHQLMVYPVFGSSARRSLKSDTSNLPAQTDFSPEVMVKRYAYPDNAQGMVICHGGSLHRICWFNSAAQMEMRWFSLITEAKNAMPFCQSGKPLELKVLAGEISTILKGAEFEISADSNGLRCLNFKETFAGQAKVGNDGKLEQVDLRMDESVLVNIRSNQIIDELIEEFKYCKH